MANNEVETAAEKETREKTSDLDGQSSIEKEKPKYLPADFPLPDDAKITTSQAGMDDNKKHSLLIFESEQSMDNIKKMYEEYFEHLSDDSQIIDDKNLIIQGIDQKKNYDWSLIGGTLAERAGVIEIQVTWTEL